MPQEVIETAATEGFENVQEAWPLYDTLIVSPTLYGQESSVNGWFTSFDNFAQNERHSFFKNRTEASASLAYCNKQTADTMDFAMEVYSFGCAFWAPGIRALGTDSGSGLTYSEINSQIAHWWETEFPRHCSIEFKVQQDTILELPAMAASPGYGVVGGGASFEHEQVTRITPQGVANADYLPVMNMAVTQGVPTIKNRWPFPKPIGVPRTATIEAVLTISEYARSYLSKMVGLAPQYLFNANGATPPYQAFPARFGIQVSLLGKRLVQQRAQYHR